MTIYTADERVNFQPSPAPVVIVEDHDSDVSCIKSFDSAAPLGSQVTPFRQRYASVKRAKAQQNGFIAGILAVECPRHEAVVPRRVRTKWISRWSCFCREQQRSWTPAVGGFCFELWRVVRCKLQTAGCRLQASAAPFAGACACFFLLRELTNTVEQTSITDAEMHAKGYLSDIIPVSTAGRDPAFPFFNRFSLS